MRKQGGDTGRILVAPVKLYLYDSLGRIASRVLSDSGTTTNSHDKFTVWGDVFVKNMDSLVIKTQRLYWNKTTHQVSSDVYVQVETKNGDIMRGKGLDADENLNNWTFRANFSGQLQNFKERIENDEPLF
jgi:LPS export ABC transporter protein LptC